MQYYIGCIWTLNFTHVQPVRWSRKLEYALHTEHKQRRSGSDNQGPSSQCSQGKDRESRIQRDSIHSNHRWSSSKRYPRDHQFWTCFQLLPQSENLVCTTKDIFEQFIRKPTTSQSTALTASTTPTPSCPGHRGNLALVGQSPMMAWMSVWQHPLFIILTSSSFGLATGTGTCNIQCKSQKKKWTFDIGKLVFIDLVSLPR